MANHKNKIIASAFASGSGSNAENIIRFAQENPEKIEIPVVICDTPGAAVIEKAKALGVPCEVVPVMREENMTHQEVRAAQEDKIYEILVKHGVEWVFLAGYMQIISAEFITRFADPVMGVSRIVNIHPALLPSFPGRDSYIRAYNSGVKVAGVSLHFVDAGVDTGLLIGQKSFERHCHESFDQFRARGMVLEYALFREFLQSLIDGTFSIESIPGTENRIVCLGGK